MKKNLVQKIATAGIISLGISGLSGCSTGEFIGFSPHPSGVGVGVSPHTLGVGVGVNPCIQGVGAGVHNFYEENIEESERTYTTGSYLLSQ